MRLPRSVIAVAFTFACGGREPLPREPPPSQPPSSESTATDHCAEPSPGLGYECVQACGPPVSREGDPPPGYHWLSAEQAHNRRQYGCPICLPADAEIATPSGFIAISQLTPGARVWSVDGNGQRVEARVLRVVSTPVPPGHELVRVELADGRVLRASPGHPDSDGRAIGSLSPADALDGSVIVAVHRIAYRGHTYDLVLDPADAQYVSDGVLMRSSLSRSDR